MIKRNPAFALLQQFGCSTNIVPSSSPSTICKSTFFLRPDAITIGIPERITIFAAWIFDAMPPTAVSLSVPPTMPSSRASIFSTFVIVRAFGF